MIKKKLFIFFILYSFSLYAQDVSFTAEAPPQVRVGQQFAITYKINNVGSGFIGPDIQNFDILSGPNVSTMRSSSNINGKVTSSVITSFTYFLGATKPGVYTIPQALINIGGKNYMSNKLTVTVVKGSPNASSTGGAPANATHSAPIVTDNVGDKISIKASIDKSTVFQGDPVIVTYKLYTPTPRMQIGSPAKIPSYPGFWAEDMMKNLTQYPQHIEGNFIVVDLRKVALYPQKTGKLNIDPLSMDVVYEVKVKDPNRNMPDDSFFANDPFFKDMIDNLSASVQRVVKTITSNTLAINVKPLPEKNKPADFSGAIGNFAISAEIDKKQALTNDALTYKVTISGNGNIMLLEKPNITFPPDFEAYEPKITDNIKSPSGGAGTRTFEYLIIPRSAGNFVINPVSYSFFDPLTQDYKVISTPEIALAITKNPNDKGLSDMQDRIKLQNTEIAPIANTPLALAPYNKFFFASLWYWIILSALLLAFILFIFFHKKNSKLRADKQYMQRQKATGIAEKRMQKAKVMLRNGNEEEFYNEVSSALWGYISDKFNIPLARLSLNTVQNELENCNLNKENCDNFIELLNHCNFARYAPPGTAVNKDDLYQNAINAINKTEQNLSFKK